MAKNLTRSEMKKKKKEKKKDGLLNKLETG